VEKLNIAVVGCGYWGPNIIRNFFALPGCEVRAVCDSRPERLKYMGELHRGLKTVSDYEELVSDQGIDAIAIATPVQMHFDLARRSLEAGKHTFIEKPMASSSSECRRLNEIAEKQQLTLMVGHTFVYNAAVRKIKEIIQDGEIGDLLYINARRLNLGLFQKDINVTWDLAPHDISIILYIIGQGPVAVNCNGRAHVASDVEDVTTMTLNFANGKMALIQSSWLDPHKIREMKFVGSRKMVVYDDIEPLEKIKIYDKHVETPPHYDTFAEFQYAYHYGDMHAPYVKMTEPLRVECQHFIDCIRSKQKPDTSGLEGMQVVQILEAASESLKRQGERVELAS